MLIIDQELKPIMLTLWDDFASKEGQKIAQMIQTKPIIIGMRLKVVSYHGTSLATRSSSTFLINISTPESEALQEWLLQNEDKIQVLINKNSEAPLAPSMKEPTADDIIPVNSLITAAKNTSSFWIKAHATVTDFNQKFWYTGCNTCWREIHADHGQTFNCRNCSGQERIVEARCRFNIELKDPTGTISATIFGKIAEEIFALDPQKLMQFSDKNDKIDTAALGICSSTKKYYFQLKPNRNNENQYIITKALDKLQQDHAEDAQKKTPLKQEANENSVHQQQIKDNTST
ncbi:hypothetical protein SOVF_025630 isoform A [Spinacia oleracea]|nr:hypothetical protein SOVF_025630 isoform A [Spinacia oleracea]